MTIEILETLLNKIKSNDSVYSIYRKSVSTLYKSLKENIIDEDEYQVDFNSLVYKLSLLVK